MTPDSTVIAVTGSTGKLGSRVARRLATAGVDQLLVGRHPDRQPELPHTRRCGPAEYGDQKAMSAAMRSASTLFLVSGNLSGRRLEEHSSAIDAAIEVGVERIVYVSLLGAAEDATYVHARDHALTEQYLAGTGVRWTVLRPSFYSSMLPGLADHARVIRGPADDGRVSAVAHDDIAAVAVAVLLDNAPHHDGQVLEVTGPESVTLAEAAGQLTDATGRAYTFRSEDTNDPDGWYAAIAHGEVATVTDVVHRLTGERALTIAENLRRQRTQMQRDERTT